MYLQVVSRLHQIKVIALNSALTLHGQVESGNLHTMCFFSEGVK